MKKSCFCVLAAVLLAFMAKADTTMTYSGNLPGTSEDSVLFENAHLLAVTGISLDIRNYFGGALMNLTLSNIVAMTPESMASTTTPITALRWRPTLNGRTMATTSVSCSS
jgi:hypothetical protein